MNTNRYKPGIHKLMLQLDHLQKLRNREVVAPIHVSIWPTIRCQLHCSYCCCKKEDREGGELSLELFKKAIDVLVKYGTRAIELSGGGEPLLWTHFNEGVKYAHEKGLKLSMITNGLALENVSLRSLEMFEWIRISLQSVAHAKRVIIDSNILFSEYGKPKISGSFIVANDLSLDKIEDIHKFASKFDFVVRVAVQRPCTEEREQDVREFVEFLGDPLFFSFKEGGQPKGCFMPYIRAAINWKGHFLPCPSTQLNVESEGKIADDFSLCTIDGLEEWLHNNPPHDLGYRCSYCNCGKEHNDLVYDLFNGIEDAEFV